MTHTSKARAQQDEMRALVTDLARDLRPIVLEIEASTATTQNHYGQYLAFLSDTTERSLNPTQRRIITLALLKAGANRQGVRSAYSICDGG